MHRILDRFSREHIQTLVHQVSRLLRYTIHAASRYRLPGLASEMAYNWMLALFPFILTALTAIGLFGSPLATYQSIIGWIQQVAPQEPLALVDSYVKAVSYGQNRGLFSISFLGAVWAASNALNAAMIALDVSHQVPHDRRRSLWRRRILAMGLTVSMMVLAGAANVFFFIGGIAVQRTAEHAGSLGFNFLQSSLLWTWRGIGWPIAISMITLSCYGIYRSGPSIRHPFIPLIPGSLCASGIWLLSSLGLRAFMTHFGKYNQVYGSVGAVIVLLLWLWLSSLALLLGEQINIGLYKDFDPRQPNQQKDPATLISATGSHLL